MTRRGVIFVAVLGPLGLAALTLTAWLTGVLRLASVRMEYIPMAPSTAIGFILTGGSVIAVAASTDALARKGAATAAMLVCTLAAVKLFEFIFGVTILNLEAALVARPGLFGTVPLARMSPLTATAFLFAAVALLCLMMPRARTTVDVAGAIGTLVTLEGATVVLGYAYGAPLLYGGRIIPMALTTGLGFVGLGVALLALAGPSSAVLRPFCGARARARLLRLFVPLTVGAILANGVFTQALLSDVNANPALLAAIFALVWAFVIGAAVTGTARTLGDTLDRAQADVERSRDELERRVLERTAELSALNRELESFSYSVSHDLRAPLRHILGFATVLREEADVRLNDEDRRHLGKVTDAAARMGRLIDDLLQLSRHTRATVHKQSTSLAALVRDAQAEVSPAAGRAITWEIHEPLPDLLVDPGLFRLVLVNLLSNAVKYTGRQAEARIEIGTSEGPDSETRLFVRDNGVGFDMKYAGKLFGVFQRLHGATDFEGTGVGLANVSRIVSRHGGRVWAESSVGQGATFYVALPRES